VGETVLKLAMLAVLAAAPSSSAQDEMAKFSGPATVKCAAGGVGIAARARRGCSTHGGVRCFVCPGPLC